MNKIHLTSLLITPLIIIASTLASMHGTGDIIAFSEELNEKVYEHNKLTNQLSDLKNAIVTTDSNLTTEFSEKILSSSIDTQNSTINLFKEFATFSERISNWTNKGNYFTLFLSVINLLIITSIYFSAKRQ